MGKPLTTLYMKIVKHRINIGWIEWDDSKNEPLIPPKCRVWNGQSTATGSNLKRCIHDVVMADKRRMKGEQE
jgi:hypothetical protein